MEWELPGRDDNEMFLTFVRQMRQRKSDLCQDARSPDPPYDTRKLLRILQGTAGPRYSFVGSIDLAWEACSLPRDFEPVAAIDLG